MLGGKAPECFVWSAAHDDDAEFLRRYGEPVRARWMLEYHANDPNTAGARQRLASLTSQP